MRHPHKQRRIPRIILKLYYTEALIMAKLLLTIFVLLYSGAVMAATGLVQTVSGDVKAAIGSSTPVTVTQNSALENGMTVTTGNNGNVIMKFEDGQVIILNANTSFKISQYHFDQAKPEKSSMIFSLFKGAMRSISGLIGKHNAGAYRLQTPVATIGIRGTDFMAVTGSLYVSVTQGVVSATNTAATTTFTAGQIGFIAGPAVAPAAMAASQLPASVASSFSQLSSVTIQGAAAGSTTSSGSATSSSTAGSTTAGSTTASTATGSAAAGGTAATGAAVGGMSTMAVAGTVAAVAGVAAIATNKSTTAATTTVTTP
ncbi:MAG: hypothetical protein A2061_11165 [Gallionellales bacterium GWA2_59_43]|nr:MAG: hypothetical protein A2061_11165 [Gallionellales bacterium GWA2_59_43]